MAGGGARSQQSVQHQDDDENEEEAGGRGVRALVVGHYCHDLIRLHAGREVESLGGSVSYVTNILDALGLHSTVISKVGCDFSYASATASHPPTVVHPAKTTRFYADFTAGSDRVLRVLSACDPIQPSDIRSDPTDYAIGLVVGVAREILPETLRRMVKVSKLVMVDIQALIRTVDPVDGTVGLRKLCETDFYDFLEEISFLKASTLEAAYVDVEEARQRTCVIITEGKNGCRVYERDREFHVPAFPAQEIDPTGAGDSFLAGFSAGMMRGLSVEDAVLVGNYFGSVTVGQIGVPRFNNEHLQILHEVLDKRRKKGVCCSTELDCSSSPTHIDPANISKTWMEELNNPNLREELDNRVRNGICIPAQLGSTEHSKSPEGEELGDFLTWKCLDE